MNGLRLYREAQRWGWGWRTFHARACPRNTRWFSASVNSAYRGDAEVRA